MVVPFKNKFPGIARIALSRLLFCAKPNRTLSLLLRDKRLMSNAYKQALRNARQLTAWSCTNASRLLLSGEPGKPCYVTWVFWAMPMEQAAKRTKKSSLQNARSWAAVVVPARTASSMVLLQRQAQGAS